MSGPLIIKIGGAGVDDPLRATDLWQAVRECHTLLRGQLVLVHGGGRAVDTHIDRLGLKTERRDGIRVTPDDQIGEIVAVLAGRVNKALVGALQTQGVRAAGLCLGDGLAVTTTRATQFEFDAGRVGMVTGGDGRLLRTLMDATFLPVLCSIGLDSLGGFLNVNADDAAAGVAGVLGARGLVLLTDVPGILDENSRPLSQASPQDIERLIERGTIKGGMIPKATAAVRAARAASAPTVIASWNVPYDLVRIARGEPAGTRVVPD